MLKTTTMKEVYERLAQLSERELILDVREPDEYAEGHVQGSRNIPLGEVGKHADSLKKFEKVYIHCRSGKRAQQAWEELSKRGVTNLVCIADGGMLEWVNAGYPVAR